jgi:hypothetical protein
MVLHFSVLSVAKLEKQSLLGSQTPGDARVGGVVKLPGRSQIGTFIDLSKGRDHGKH